MSEKDSPRYSVLVPGLPPTWQAGGLLIALQLAEHLKQFRDARVVTYLNRHDGVPFLDDVLDEPDHRNVFIITWGPHVSDLLRETRGYRRIYFAQSTGWIQREIDPRVPIWCLSRNIMSYWALKAPNNPLFYLPPAVSAECGDRNLPRDIDVLYLARKASPYLRNILIPALRRCIKLHTLETFVTRTELFTLFNRSKVYIYASSSSEAGWREGFGMQPLEAMLCGCHVFSDVSGGLSDYVDPGLNARQLQVFSVEFDVGQIQAGLRDWRAPGFADGGWLAAHYSLAARELRLRTLVGSVEAFFAATDGAWPTLRTRPSGLAMARRSLTWRIRSYRTRLWNRRVRNRLRALMK